MYIHIQHTKYVLIDVDVIGKASGHQQAISS